MKTTVKCLGIFLMSLLFIISACKKHKYYRNDDGFSNNVNYPAAFIVNGADNSLEVLQLSTTTITDKIQFKGATFPHHIYLNGEKSLMAIAFTNADLSGGHSEEHGGHEGHGSPKNMVQIFETRTGKHVANVFLTNPTHNAAFSPDGTELWISQSNESGTIYIVDTEKWKKKAIINVGVSPSEITFSADGTKAYATNTGGNSVTIIQVSNKSVINTVNVGDTPVGAWPAPNGKMYVDNEVSKTISEIDVQNNTVSSTIYLGFKPAYVVYHKPANELWVSDAENGRVVFYEKNMSGSWVITGSLATGTDAHAMVFSTDYTTCYVTNQGAHTVSIVNTSTHSILQTVSVGQKPNGIALKE